MRSKCTGIHFLVAGRGEEDDFKIPTINNNIFKDMAKAKICHLNKWVWRDWQREQFVSSLWISAGAHLAGLWWAEEPESRRILLKTHAGKCNVYIYTTHFKCNLYIYTTHLKCNLYIETVQCFQKAIMIMSFKYLQKESIAFCKAWHASTPQVSVVEAGAFYPLWNILQKRAFR